MSNYKPDLAKGAVNPYTFVSLGSEVKRGNHAKGDLSGVIHCSMKNETSLALPDLPNAVEETLIGEKGKTEKHKKAPFFKVNGKPVITGSEIKGVIRSAYETLSNSCLSVNNNNILSARTSAVRQPGVLCFTDGSWHLYKASMSKTKPSEEDIVKRKWKDIHQNHETVFWFTKGDKIETEKRGIPESDLKSAIEKCYIEAQNMYRKTMLTDPDKSDLEEKKFFPPLKTDGTPNPVFYWFEQGHLYLSPAQISRSVYYHRANDLLGSHSHCEDTTKLCEACALFGMIGKDCEPSSIASRLRFTDAKLENDAKLTYKTLKELSSPRLSSIEFYSTAPNMKFQWNYDTKGVKLNGRKFYFHHNCDCTTTEKTGRNLTTELLEKGAEFSFDIFFDKLNESELNRLVWTLAIGENSPNSHRMHKLGHGKPLGLGSVKITVDSVTKRSFDPDRMIFTNEEMNVDLFFENVPFDTSAEYFKEYMAVTDFDYLEGRPVAYPYGDDGGNGETSQSAISWFKGNRNDGSVDNKGQGTIKYYLPKITDKDHLTLPALIKSNRSNYNKNPKRKTEHGNKSSHSSNQVKSPQSNKQSPKKEPCPKCHKMITYNTQDTQIIKCTECGFSFLPHH